MTILQIVKWDIVDSFLVYYRVDGGQWMVDGGCWILDCGRRTRTGRDRTASTSTTTTTCNY